MAAKAGINANGVRDPSLRSTIGRQGEALAADFFVRCGYVVVARNWSCRWGELDLVVRKGDDVRIVEVKTRRVSSGSPAPHEAVTDRKLARIGEAAARFFHQHPDLPDEAHIDVLAVMMSPVGAPTFRWIKDFE